MNQEQESKQMKELFTKPCIMAVVGDVNEGKSMLLYSLLEELTRTTEFKLFYYGLRLDFTKQHSQRVYSIAEIEQVRNSIIIIDELSSLFDLENRKSRRIIENTLRLIHHNNNVLVLCGTPENFKKFISAKLNVIIYKKCQIADFINGSTVKNTLLAYNGNERGSAVLTLLKNEALVYDGKHYKKFDVNYLKEYDTKKSNEHILKPRRRNEASHMETKNL